MGHSVKNPGHVRRHHHPEYRRLACETAEVSFEDIRTSSEYVVEGKLDLWSGGTIPASNLEQLSAIQEIASAAEHLSNLATVLQQTVNLFAVL